VPERAGRAVSDAVRASSIAIAKKSRLSVSAATAMWFAVSQLIS
jgi:hypothetical protein